MLRSLLEGVKGKPWLIFTKDCTEPGGCQDFFAGEADSSKTPLLLLSAEAERTFPLLAEGLKHTIRDDRDQGHAESGHKSESEIRFAQSNVDGLAQPFCANQRRDHQHRQGEHDGLVQSEHDFRNHHKGRRTSQSTCRGLQPSARAASTTVGSTCRSPCSV